MTETTTREITWRTSTRSSNAGGQCEKIGASSQDIVEVRDSQDRSGGTLTVPSSEWAGWISALKHNTFGA